MTNPRHDRSFMAKLVVGIPYAWLAALFLVPFLIVLKISLSQTAIAQPPYTPVLDLAAGWQGLRHFFAGLSLDNYAFLGSDPLRDHAHAAPCASGAGAAGHPAVLDVVSNPHLRVDEHPAA